MPHQGRVTVVNTEHHDEHHRERRTVNLLNHRRLTDAPQVYVTWIGVRMAMALGQIVHADSAPTSTEGRSQVLPAGHAMTTNTFKAKDIAGRDTRRPMGGVDARANPAVQPRRAAQNRHHNKETQQEYGFKAASLGHCLIIPQIPTTGNPYGTKHPESKTRSQKVIMKTPYKRFSAVAPRALRCVRRRALREPLSIACAPIS
jgi:hypothetical protein